NALVADDTNPWTETATAIDRVLGLQRLKCQHTDGEYSAGDAGIIPRGTRAIAHCEDMELGSKKWEDGRCVDTRWGRIADKFIPPSPGDLPDNEPRLQPDGTSRRPWQFGMEVPVTLLTPGSPAYRLQATSGRAIGAMSGLSRAYGKRRDE